jgi:hypothetical protein
MDKLKRPYWHPLSEFPIVGGEQHFNSWAVASLSVMTALGDSPELASRNLETTIANLEALVHADNSLVDVRSLLEKARTDDAAMLCLLNHAAMGMDAIARRQK